MKKFSQDYLSTIMEDERIPGCNATTFTHLGVHDCDPLCRCPANLRTLKTIWNGPKHYIALRKEYLDKLIGGALSTIEYNNQINLLNASCRRFYAWSASKEDIEQLHQDEQKIIRDKLYTLNDTALTDTSSYDLKWLIDKIKKIIKFRYSVIVNDLAWRAIHCIYLVHLPDGTLFYVGQTKDLRQRLMNHIKTPDSTLIKHVIIDRNINSSSVHICQCGNNILCGKGEKNFGESKIFDDLRNEIAQTFDISIIVTPDHWSKERMINLENMVKLLMNARHGR